MIKLLSTYLIVNSSRGNTPLVSKTILTTSHPRLALAGHVPHSSVSPGSIVYHAADRNKSTVRPRYLVSSVDGNWCYARTFTGEQLRAKLYKFHRSECYAVPATSSPFPEAASPSTSSDEDDAPSRPSAHRRRVPSLLPSPVAPPHPAPAPLSHRDAIGAMFNCRRSLTILLSRYARSVLCLFGSLG